MALSFNQQTGSAKKSDMPLYKYTDGDNCYRIVGDILPRYLYWIDNPAGGNQIPFECLAFGRDSESFDRLERDYVREFFPDINCSWSYATQGLVEGANGPELVVIPLKKKLWEQIITAAEDLGDPTDPETGWDIMFKRVKTGPKAFNVEYQLQTVKIMKEGQRPLTDEEKKLVASLKSMDEVIPRESPETQLQRLENMKKKPAEETAEAQEEMEDEFDID